MSFDRWSREFAEIWAAIGGWVQLKRKLDEVQPF